MASHDPVVPNVLLILADDLGYWALGSTGNCDIQTPVLDRLATSGLMLTNFYCASPVCSPARASLMTGMIPSQHGVHDWIAGGHVGNDAIDFLGSSTTLAGELNAAGWRCALIGKWHLGASDRPRAEYATWYAHESGGGPYYGATMFRGDSPEIVEGYLTDDLAQEAVHLIGAECEVEQPFFLSLNFTAPHHPWRDAHPVELTKIYANKEFSSIPEAHQSPDLLFKNPEVAAAIQDPRDSLIGYYAAATGMDRAIGRVLTTLEEHGLTESTLVVFMSDNGFNCGHHGIWGKGNGTYPQNMFDTSVKVPAIFSQPGRIPGGRSSNKLLSGYDFFPTILDYVGLPDEPSKRPGRTFKAGLEASQWPHREHIVVFDEYGPVRMIRTPEWKYVHRYAGGEHELYDMVNDPNETKNLVHKPSLLSVRRQLRAELEQWFAQNVEPDRDGVALPVTGLGQLNTKLSDGTQAFVQLDQVQGPSARIKQRRTGRVRP